MASAKGCTHPRCTHPQWSVGIGYTSRCNMTCPFCYSKESRKAHKELPLTLWKDFFLRNHQRIEAVNYGTGENTLAPAWFELIRFVRERFPSIRQALTTNGYLSRAIQDREKERSFLASIDEVDVSLDFADAARHSAFRGNPDAYRLARESLEVCSAHGKTVTLVMIGLDETLELSNLAGLTEIAGRLGALMRINLYRPYPGQGLQPPRFESITRSLEWLFEHHQVVSLSDPLFNAMYNYDGRERADPSGKGSLRIIPGGEITPSTYLISPDWFAGYIWEDDVLERLPSTRPFRALREACIPTECLGCQLVDKCRGGTYDRRVLFYGTLEQRDPYCPFRKGQRAMPLPRHLRFYGDTSVVHADYLPTLIFKPMLQIQSPKAQSPKEEDACI